MRKYWYRRFLLVLLVLSILGYAGYEITKRQEQGRKKEVSADTVSSDTVIPGGMPVGIYLETEGVMVLGTEKITGADGEMTEPARHLVKAGDYIVECNGKKIADKKRLQDTLKKLDAEEVVLKLRRDSGYLDVKIKPVRNKKNQYMLGIWVRDNAQGLGTGTFLNTDSRFGALGHGIHDTDTNTLMEIKDGRVYETSIRSIQKGAGGEPGGIEGIIVYNRYNVLGTIDKNTDCGIFGTLERTDNLFRNTEPVGIMATDEIKKIITEITEKSKLVEATMQENEVLQSEQQEAINRTEEIFGEIMKQIEMLGSGMERINTLNENMSANKDLVVDKMGTIASVSEQSAAATEEVNASTEQVNVTMAEISEHTGTLQAIAKDLMETINRFKLS